MQCAGEHVPQRRASSVIDQACHRLAQCSTGSQVKGSEKAGQRRQQRSVGPSSHSGSKPSGGWSQRERCHEPNPSHQVKGSTRGLPPRPKKDSSGQQQESMPDRSNVHGAQGHASVGTKRATLTSVAALGLFATREVSLGVSSERHALKMLAPHRDEELDELARIVQQRRSHCWAQRRGKLALDDDLASMAFDSEL
jgi:hypothetical protein